MYERIEEKIKMIKQIFYIVGVAIFIITTKFAISSFEQKFPETITKQEFIKIQKNADTGFTFVSDVSTFDFQYRAGRASVTFKIYKNIDSFLSSDDKKIFTESTVYINQNPVKIYTLHYGDLSEEKYQDFQKIAQPNSEEFWKSYLFSSKRRVFETEQNPKLMSIEELKKYLKNNKIIFYTGAGTSMAGGVWGMNELESNLGLDMDEYRRKPEKIIKNLVEKREKILSVFKEFCKKMFFNPATKAHWAIKKIAQSIKAAILTENQDYLHEQTGIKPHRLFNVKRSKKIFNAKFLKEIKAVVCIGLSFDDRAFLAWYKENNPDGVIISIDLSQSNYLGDEDYLVKGDLQKILVSVAGEF
jgi:hypothetical protein